MILVHVYVGIVLMSFMFIWARHFYLIHIKLNRYMLLRHPSEWKAMKENLGWYRPQWATLYYSKAVYDFIWRSGEDFGDENVSRLKRMIKAFIRELPIYFLSVTFITLLLIWFRVLG